MKLFKPVYLGLSFFLLTLSFVADAQSSNGSPSSMASEQAIRNLVSQINQGQMVPRTAENIFVSGRYPEAIIGGRMSEVNKKADAEATANRRNFKVVYRIERIVVAKAEDMAYEFGYADLSYDKPDNTHAKGSSTYLRVWRHLDGEWKLDVTFVRPNPVVTNEKK